MPRKLRIQFDGAWYHVMNRGINHGKIFFSDEHRLNFIELLKTTTSNYQVEIHAYCLMGNHYHLILHTPIGNISHAIHYLNSQHTKYINKTLKRSGPLFKGRYHTILINDEKYLLRVSRYIHRNPLKAKMVTNLKEYPWSSYPYYLGQKGNDWIFKNREKIAFFLIFLKESEFIRDSNYNLFNFSS